MSVTLLPPWQPENYGDLDPGLWFLYRDATVPFRDRYHFDDRGDLIWYASRQSARRAARRMNTAERAAANRAHIRALLATRQPEFAAALETAISGRN